MTSKRQRQQHIKSNRRLMELYNKRARRWGEQYMARHWWRFRAMYDIEDIRQDAFSVFLRVYRRHPDLDEPDLFRIFKRGVQGRVDNRSRQCFPNSYAYVADQGKLVLDIDESTNQQDEGYGNIEDLLTYWSDILTDLPNELMEVLRLLTQDFLGVTCIEQRRRKRLGGRSRVEPLNMSIARTLGMSPSRDFLTELEMVMMRSSGKA